MPVRSNDFSPEAFFTALKGDKLDTPLIVPGLVKLDEKHPDQIMFAVGGSCEDWIPVALSMIAEIEFIRKVPCQDHTHPLVFIRFKAPETPEGLVFAHVASKYAARDVSANTGGTSDSSKSVHPEADGCLGCINNCFNTTVGHEPYYNCVQNCQCRAQ